MEQRRHSKQKGNTAVRRELKTIGGRYRPVSKKPREEPRKQIGSPFLTVDTGNKGIKQE